MHFFTQSDEPWGVKDSQSRYIYANQEYFNFLEIHIDIAKNISNYSYEAVPALAPLTARLIAHDQKVMQTGQRLEAVGTLLIGDSYRSFVFEKYPFFDKNGTTVGTVFHLKPFERLSMGYFLEKPFYGVATFSPPTDIFTKREWEVFFLLFRGLHRTQAAEFLGITDFSVRNVISRLFLRTGVSSKETLLALGVDKGWHLYVPPKFASIGYDILFKDNISK
jgi:DNA-binding CsgD family transcriptional regulator